MKQKLYVETSVVGYLTSWPSRDIVVAARQQITRQWQKRKDHFQLFTSDAVIEEAGAGDSEAAADRLTALAELPLLEIDEEVLSVATELMSSVPLPERASVDAVHIAVSVIHAMDYLLTWNCTHIANAALRPRIESVCGALGFSAPIICTPEELMENLTP